MKGIRNGEANDSMQDFVEIQMSVIGTMGKNTLFLFWEGPEFTVRRLLTIEMESGRMIMGRAEL